ncbi:MAG: single-stranded DNA-binding protein [Clostridia bacterium]|nr:single-stranded DNA-binding protein [Clostridia bacterium]
MLNKAILMGRLVADPELRRTPNNNSVTSFTLAVNRSFTRQGEQPQTDFIDIVAWGKTAEFVSRYFVKGQLVAVAGRIQTRTWEDKQGNKRKTVEVVAEEVHFAEPKRDSQPRNEMPHGGFDPMAGLGGNAFAALPGDDNDLPF